MVYHPYIHIPYIIRYYCKKKTFTLAWYRLVQKRKSSFNRQVKCGANHRGEMTAKRAIGEALRSLGKQVRISHSTLYPTVYGIDGINMDEFYFNRHGAARKKLFIQSSLHYVPPKEFNFQLPNAERGEVCFIGRSNVGKSSLIEAITGNKGIAKVSQTPGCTKILNFFAFIPHRFQNVKTVTTDHHRAYLVDMPGYGYAKVSREEQDRWLKVMNDYLLNRDQTVLRRTFLLVDGRHGVKPSDMEMMLMLNRSFIPYQLIFTKSDLVKENDLIGNIKAAFGMMMQMKNGSGLPYIHAVSSTTGSGIETLQLALAEIYTDEKYNQSANTTTDADAEASDDDFDANIQK